MAAQDQGIMTNAFKKMAGLTNDNKCRFCHTETESVSQLIASCQTLLADGYHTARHDGVCKYLHWTICKSLNIKCSSKVWEHQPGKITGSDRHTIYVIPTATYLENAAVKPDLVIWDKAEKRPLIIEVGIPHDSGLNRAESLTSHKISRPDARHEEKLEFEGDLNCSCYLWCNRTIYRKRP